MSYIKKHPIIMIIVGVFGISLSSIFVKYSSAPSSVTAMYRLLWTILLQSPVVFASRPLRTELLGTKPKTTLLCSLSGLFLAIHFVLWFESLNHTSVASSTTIVCTEVIWVSLGYCLLMKGHIPFKAIIAIIATLLGSMLIALSQSSDKAHLYGVILALLAAIAVAVYMLIGRVVRTNTSTTVYTYIVYSVCTLTLIIICIIQQINPFKYGANPVFIGLLLAVFSTILGHSIFSWCLKYFSPSFVSASKLCEPVVAAILAAILFAEIPHPVQLTGGALILGGVYYYSRLENK
ncbi:MAG: DMT family transporter [Clostridia bacterium]|nr:DMT family transporter [Clostridia bacterium]